MAPLESETCMILFYRELSTKGILQALRDETLNDPRDRIEIAQSHAFYRPSLLGQLWCFLADPDRIIWFRLRMCKLEKEVFTLHVLFYLQQTT